MTSASDLFDPVQHYLELSASDLTEAWEQSQSGGTPASRWNHYLNRLCLNLCLPWFQAERCAQATVWPNLAATASFWELVNGTAFVLNGKRIVLIPSEAIDTSELRVPQEWVDLPTWAADYYLGAKVNPDDLSIQLWGYCTHQRLKTSGHYDDRDRAYAINEEDLVTDLSALWVVRQLNPEEPTRAPLPSLPAIPLAQAENLLERLGNPALLLPRLAVPFQLWGGLMEHGGWRQRLAEQRQGGTPGRSVWQWLQGELDRWAQQQGWNQVNFQPRTASARSNASTLPPTILARPLVIAEQPYELRILPLDEPALLGGSGGSGGDSGGDSDADASIWRFELSSLLPGGRIPAGFKLRLLTEDLQPFEGNEDTASPESDQLYVEVSLNPGEGLVWEIEPLPEGYDREILRF